MSGIGIIHAKENRTFSTASSRAIGAVPNPTDARVNNAIAKHLELEFEKLRSWKFLQQKSRIQI